MYKHEYAQKITTLLDEVYNTNKDNIQKLAQLFAENIMNDKIIHTFGSGHSHIVGIEMFARAGGLGNINALLDPDVLTSSGAQRGSAIEKVEGLADIIYDNYLIEKGDIMIITSNSGRNALPIEMALRCKKEGIYCVGITALEQSTAMTSRHSSGKKLYEIVDMVLDNKSYSGDALININGIKTGPSSTITSTFLMNTIISEAIKIVVDKGFKPMVFQSQNVDGFSNEEIYEHYKGRIKGF